MPAGAWSALEARLRQRASQRELSTPQEQLPQAAVALVLAPLDGRAQALLVRRAERAGDPWSGHMALPGGRREDADADLFATAVRETREELGLDLGLAAHWGELDDHAPQTQVSPRILVRPFVFALPRPCALRLSEEIAEARWWPLDELARTRQMGSFELRGALVRLPFYQAGECRVWGMTQRILEPLLEALA